MLLTLDENGSVFLFFKTMARVNTKNSSCCCECMGIVEKRKPIIAPLITGVVFNDEPTVHLNNDESLKITWTIK